MPVDCNPHATALGYLGVSFAVVFANFGAAYGTSKSGMGVSTIGVMNPATVMRCLIPVVMAGVLGIYGLMIGILVSQGIDPPTYALHTGWAHLTSGLVMGFSCLAAGYAIGLVGDVGVRCTALQPKVFVGLVLIMIFSEVLAIYGMIVALIVGVQNPQDLCVPWV